MCKPTYSSGTKAIQCLPPVIKLMAGGGALTIVGIMLHLMSGDNPIFKAPLHTLGSMFMVVGVPILALSIWVYTICDKEILHIYGMVRVALYAADHGNPLRLRDGDQLPEIRCRRSIKAGRFVIKVLAGAATVETITDASSAISSALNKGKFRRYAVVTIEADPAFNEVDFIIEDVLADKSLHYPTVEAMTPYQKAVLQVQKDTEIDLTTSGSMLVAGKTRSGKTTGVIALLLQILLQGRDNYGSEVLIIDPKQAELSRLPHVVTLDQDGEAIPIIKALQAFADTITERQKVLNELAEKTGDAMPWWDAGMAVSIVFLDEYVALRSLFPKKPPKDNPDYCLDVFDGLLKRIVTMGASAGCYAIISIAEASVESGGLPAMLRSAMSTKILFRPTMPEARLMWDSELLKDLPQRTYGPGDAWFSSTDGNHDIVSYVHFPHLDFAVYRELGRLLDNYYSNPSAAI